MYSNKYASFFSIIFDSFFNLLVLWIWLEIISSLPLVAAAPIEQQSFPDIPFLQITKFIQKNFDSTVSLSTVLMLLFTITENTDLLNLHFSQRAAQVKEHSTLVTGWIRGLASTVKQRLEEENASLLKESDMDAEGSEQKTIITIGLKLDALARLLGLNPLNKSGRFRAKLKPVSNKQIQAAYTLCPNTPICTKLACQKKGLYQWTRARDVPLVRMIKNFVVYDNTPLFSGHCKGCKTTYYADHARAKHETHAQHERVYLNSARYIKIGQNLWVDRAFSNAVLSGIYNFHASAAAYAEFWNNSFNLDNGANISRRHVWQAFVQESIRLIASASDTNLTIMDGLAIDEVTREAFNALGEGGIIKSGDQHSCSECTQKYRSTADVIVEANANEADMVGMEDRNQINDDQGRMQEIDEVEEEAAPVQMVVVDGIVMGHTHCAFEGCDADLGNARGGVYCPLHELLYGGICHAANCQNANVEGTLACEQHQGKWRRHLLNHRKQVMGGYRRALRRPDDTVHGMPHPPRQVHPHDDEEQEIRGRDCFIAPRIYCVETICAPCGVVVAWDKFTKSESPTNILKFLGSVYQDKDKRPAYICIDKACMVLRKCVNDPRLVEWLDTSRFIVDAYHYLNHRATDDLCRTWCNPAPLNGSAPNLVITGRNAQGQLYYKRAFNTQACEQLNAWLGGFESILKRMKSGNFNWFLHTMLFYHTIQVLKRQRRRESEDGSESDEDEVGEGDENL